MIGTINGLHSVRESKGLTVAVVLEPILFGIVFGDARKSAILTQTEEEMEKLFKIHYLKFRRRVSGEQVLAVIVTLTSGMTVELHRDVVSAVKAFEEHMAGVKDEQSA